MTVRFATPTDSHPEIVWLRADNPDGGPRVLVEEVDGTIVGAAMRMPNALSPALDFLESAVPGAASVDLFRTISDLAPAPVLMRGLPGTPAHQLAMAAGAEVFERVPAGRIDPTDPEVLAWARAHQGPTRPGTDYSDDQLTALWIDYYVAGHQHFGVTDDAEVLHTRLGGFVRRAMNQALTRIVEVDGLPVAGAFVFTEGEALMGLVDAVSPSHPRARQCVEVAMAALIESVPGTPIELDGHESGAHYPAVLASVPNVTAGTLTPMELLRLDPRWTGRKAPEVL